jgi:hypothetical protein
MHSPQPPSHVKFRARVQRAVRPVPVDARWKAMQDGRARGHTAVQTGAHPSLWTIHSPHVVNNGWHPSVDLVPTECTGTSPTDICGTTSDSIANRRHPSRAMNSTCASTSLYCC